MGLRGGPPHPSTLPLPLVGSYLKGVSGEGVDSAEGPRVLAHVIGELKHECLIYIYEVKRRSQASVLWTWCGLRGKWPVMEVRDRHVSRS